jgi:hypothetical protein
MNIGNHHFYKDLPGIHQFSNIVEISQSLPLPNDWPVIATDVRGSKDVIANGKYMAVNMAGASANAAIFNDFPDLNVPFVFGGDRVTIVMPDLGKDHVTRLSKDCKSCVDANST